MFLHIPSGLFFNSFLAGIAVGLVIAGIGLLSMRKKSREEK
jgi:hypothetical protein